MKKNKNISQIVDNANLTKDDLSDLRYCFSTFATGVAIVTTLTETGENVGLTVNSFSSLSLSPPMVLWCLDDRSESVGLFLKDRPFTVNILAHDQAHLAKVFSSNNHDRFKHVTIAGNTLAAPIIEGCLAWFECKVEHLFKGGDHHIIVGRVESFGRYDKTPLVFHEGQYASLD